jgi:hypothetical protein
MPGKSKVSRVCDWTRRVSSSGRHWAVNGAGAPIIPLAMVLIGPVAAHATPCGDQIARLEAAQSEVVPYTRQSVGAQLHHQPTPGTVSNAESEAKRQLSTALATARKLDSEGKDSECIATLDKAGLIHAR